MANMSLTAPIAKMACTRNGEQYSLSSIDLHLMARKNRSFSINRQKELSQVIAKDTSSDTVSSLAVSMVQGDAGTQCLGASCGTSGSYKSCSDSVCDGLRINEFDEAGVGKLMPTTPARASIVMRRLLKSWYISRVGRPVRP